jgi:ABC-type nitrate/sulfonate/bicarbonate transport system substrate-binding protein
MNMLNFSSWRHWLGLVVAITTMTTTACTQPKATSRPAQSQPLTSATLNWIGNSSYYVADKKGLFAENGLVAEEIFLPTSSEV